MRAVQIFEKQPPAFRNDNRLRLELPIRFDSLFRHFAG